MAFRRRSCVLAALLALSYLAATATAGDHGLTVFWGRNQDEGSLREACDTGIYNTVIISFYSVFGHGRYWGDLSGHPLYAIGADIKHCRAKGIVVLLSIGGGGTQYSLPSSQSAADVADNLWNAHLGGGRPGVFRPFGDAVVDGIDFFIDQGAPDHYDELARRLSGYNRHYRGAPGVRLTATPRCVCPDWRVQRALDTGLFERIHLRFFGEDRCSYNRVHKDGVMAQWTKWTARYPRSKVYIGLPAGGERAGEERQGRPHVDELRPYAQREAGGELRRGHALGQVSSEESKGTVICCCPRKAGRTAGSLHTS
ncbi:xylanase inhibitor protein 1-like [Hordeum vulgare]|nr:xylanase inhibitor protein 1-like [Hordeum vulgare]